MIPQLIYIALLIFGLSLHLIKHGQPRKEKYNIFTYILGTVLVTYILYAGGFWDVMLTNL